MRNLYTLNDIGYFSNSIRNNEVVFLREMKYLHLNDDYFSINNT